MIAKRLTLVAALAIAFTSAGCSCEKKAPPTNSEEAAAPLDPEVGRKALEDLRLQSKGIAERFRLLKAHAADLPDDMLGLVEFKESMSPTENVLGTSASQAQSLCDELEAALRGTDAARIQFLHAQVTSASRDLKFLEPKLVEFTHQLGAFDEGVTRQTSWVHKLPTGYEIKAAPGGLERRLIDFASNLKADVKSKSKSDLKSTATVEPESWYRFDRVSFITITAEINQPRSEAQLTNLIEILKAFPSLELDLSAFDLEFQQEPAVLQRTAKRVDALKAELVRRGVLATRLHLILQGPVCPPESPGRCSTSMAARPLVR